MLCLGQCNPNRHQIHPQSEGNGERNHALGDSQPEAEWVVLGVHAKTSLPWATKRKEN